MRTIGDGVARAGYSLCAAVAAIALQHAAANAAPFLGTIKTLPGTLPFVTSISYDPDRNDFFVLSNEVGTVSLFRVTPGGDATLITSDVDDHDANIAYSSTTRSIYVVDPSHEEILEIHPHDGQLTLL